GRRRAASGGSSSSSDEEPGPVAAPPPPAPGPGSEREAEPEEGEEDSGSVAASPEGAGAATAEAPLSPEEPAGGPGDREESDEEFFKVKKPSFNEVTFRIQKKESLRPVQTEIEDSKNISQLEPRTGNSKCVREDAEEKGDESYSSLSEDYNNSESENESSSLQRRKDLSPGHIPSAAHIEAARRKRHLARTQADYLPLDVSKSHQGSWRREGSDLESEDESDKKNLNFVPKLRTLRQRMAEHMGEFVLFLPVVV
ncbi:GCFC2 factor, partial [Glaucidium brasilianum]|nr:GCFC2 factor [Glaucidium brasilianum]